MLVTVKAACAELGVSLSHARRQIKRGAWPFYKLGPRILRFDIQELRDLGRLVANGESVDPEKREGGAKQ